jgi:hypothetical protein
MRGLEYLAVKAVEPVVLTYPECGRPGPFPLAVRRDAAGRALILDRLSAYVTDATRWSRCASLSFGSAAWGDGRKRCLMQ